MRNKYFQKTCNSYYPLLPVIRTHAHNQFEREYAQSVIDRFDDTFGRPGPYQRTKTALAHGLAAVEKARMHTIGAMRQPGTVVTRYKPGQD